MTSDASEGAGLPEGVVMGNRRLHGVTLVLLLSSFSSSGQTQEPLADAPRLLAYSAPLIRGARQMGMAVDAAGRIYVAGYICEPILPVTPDALQPSYGGGCDGFIAILSPDRRLAYATYLGGNEQERISAIHVDAAGNVYVAGDTSSANFPTTAGAYDRTFEAGAFDVFVTKLTPTGAIAYSTLLGGNVGEFATSIAADASGRAHIVGYTNSPDFPTTTGALSRAHHGGDDGFYTRIDASGGSVSYSTYVGGFAADGAQKVVLDAAGAAYVAGTTDSDGLPTTRAVQPTTGGGVDAC
jgi:hypothetical protein